MGKRGIDISRWQHNWVLDSISNTDIRFVIIKAGGSDGGRYKDQSFEEHYAAAKFKHLQVGAYFYGTPTSVADAINDADYFVSCINNKKFDLPLFYDIEEQDTLSLGEQTVCQIIEAFCNRVNSLLSSNGVVAPNTGFYVYDGWLWYQNPYTYVAPLSQRFPLWYANINDYAQNRMSIMESKGVKFYMHQYAVKPYANSTYPWDLDHDEILDKKFIVRKTAPISNDKYIRFYNTLSVGGLSHCIPGQYSYGSSCSQANVLPNCVGWSCGRFNEVYSQVNNLTADVMHFTSLNCNAGGFIARVKNTYKNLTYSESKNAKPELGSIIVLSTSLSAPNNVTAPGHVLNVEEIVDRGHIRISESGWANADTMRFRDWYWDENAQMWDNALPPNGWYHRNGYYQVGIIYNPAITGIEVPTTYPLNSGSKLSDLTVQYK